MVSELIKAGGSTGLGALVGRGLAYLGELRASARQNLMPNLEDLSWTDAFWSGEFGPWLCLNHPIVYIGGITAIGVAAGLAIYGYLRD